MELAEDLAGGRVIKALRESRFDAPSSVAARGDNAFAVDAGFRLGGSQYEILVLPVGEDSVH